MSKTTTKALLATAALAALSTADVGALSTADLSVLTTEAVGALDAASLQPLDAATAAFAETGSAQSGEILGDGLGAGVTAITGAAAASAVVDEADLHRIELEASAGDRAGDAVAAAEAVQATHVEARVLAECEFGQPNDLAEIPVDRVVELEKAFVIDTHPAAVLYAKSLASDKA